MKSRSGQDCSRFMFFDIETIPDFSRINLFNIPEIPETLPFSSCPEPTQFILGPTGTKPIIKLEAELSQMLGERVLPPAEWIEKCISVEQDLGKQRAGVFKLLNSALSKISGAIDASEKALRQCSVDPHKCRILSIGIAIGDGDVEVKYADLTGNSADSEEQRLLTWFWDMAAETTQFCGYNVHGFDLPVIFVRSAYLAIQPTRPINMSKYSGDVLDMYVQMGEKGKLKDILSLNRIGEDYEDGMHGGKVLEQWKAGEHGKITEYQRLDVVNERELFRHFSGYFWV